MEFCFYPGGVQLWDVDQGCCVRVMEGHAARVGSLAWNSYILSRLVFRSCWMIVLIALLIFGPSTNKTKNVMVSLCIILDRVSVKLVACAVIRVYGDGWIAQIGEQWVVQFHWAWVQVQLKQKFLQDSFWTVHITHFTVLILTSIVK